MNQQQCRGESLSLWQNTWELPKYDRLQKNIRADVCIVGGGIAGLTTAYLLAQKGKSVVLVEAAELGSGQSGKTTAHFTLALDERYFDLEKLHGPDAAILIAESHAAAIKKVEHIVRSENLFCDMEKVSGYLFAKQDSRKDILEKELAACYRVGVENVQLLKDSPSKLLNTEACLEFPNQLQLHILKYLSGLAHAVTRMGGQIFTHTQVIHAQGGEEAHVLTKEGLKIYSEDVVVATNTPFNDLVVLHTKQAPYRTYVLAFKIPKNSREKAIYWDTLDPYHYIRFESGGVDHDVLIVGGEDHKTGQELRPYDCYTRLEEWTRKNFEQAGEVLYKWSGQVMESFDGLGFLGHNPLDKKNIYVISGDSGNGMTHSTIGAMIISDQICRVKNPWEDIYAPHRITLKSSKTFLKENLNVAAQYTDWLKVKEKHEFSEIAPEAGIVFRKGLKMIAAYKDKENNMEFYSAACPHLGGVLRWNSAEKSWDCPCHGSRFDCHGHVIEGPAYQDLQKENYNQ